MLTDNGFQWTNGQVVLLVRKSPVPVQRPSRTVEISARMCVPIHKEETLVKVLFGMEKPAASETTRARNEACIRNRPLTTLGRRSILHFDGYESTVRSTNRHDIASEEIVQN